MSEGPGFEALIQAILDGRAPVNVRSAAARGALPLPRATLARLYVHLLQDSESEIRTQAEASLNELKSPEVIEVLAEADCPPEILSHFAKRAARDEALAERIAFHPATPDAALAVLASTGSPAVIELVLTNEERLRGSPALLDRLMSNPTLRPGQQGRILELIERSASWAAAASRAANADAEGGPSPEEMAEAARLLEVDVGELLTASEILGGEELANSDDPGIRTAYQMIITLNAAQKAILAMKGGREERTILIRDTNKVVALGVLKNPRLTEQEIEGIANMRNVTEDVLRVLGNHREWVKGYGVVKALVYNPRTPQGITANFVSRLNNRDLKMLVSSREVPELIRRMARRTHELRTKPQGRPLRKKG